MRPLEQQQRKRRKVPEDPASETAPQDMAQKPFAQSLQQFLQAPTQLAPTEQIVHDYVDVSGLCNCQTQFPASFAASWRLGDSVERRGALGVSLRPVTRA